MKHLLSLNLLLTMLTLQTTAHVWRLNNNTLVQADFNSLNAAVTSSSVLSGDTLYLEGSSNDYGSATLNKKLTIIGTGYFLTDTANHKTQWNPNEAKTSTITFAPGSTGSVISGVYINAGCYLNDSLVTVERCRITSDVYLASATNTYADHDTIRQCWMNGVDASSSLGLARGFLVYNNIVYGSSNLNNVTHPDGYFINNIFWSGYFPCANCVFQNNIFNSTYFGSYGTSNYFSHNIFTQSSSTAGVPTGNSNQFSVALNTIFIASNVDYYWVPAGYSHDGQFRLAVLSPAVGAGDINGTTVDCGAFGGPATYVLSGMPHIPSIYSLTVPASVPVGTSTMNISFSAAAH